MTYSGNIRQALPGSAAQLINGAGLYHLLSKAENDACRD